MAPDYTKQEAALFKKWRKKRKAFIPDGVVDSTAYISSSPRICYILKEVNDTSENPDWDLREFVRLGGRPQTWNNIARWTDGIRKIYNNDSSIDWSHFALPTTEYRIEKLQSICAMNLKKTPGTHTANYKEFEAAAAQDADYLKEQYGIYSPNITICAGSSVFHLFTQLMNIIDKKQTSRGVEYLSLADGNYIINFSHPEARIADNILLYGLLDAILEIKNYD